MREEVEIQVKYASYVQRQIEEIGRFKSQEHVNIPPDLDFGKVHGLSTEVVQKLEKVRPANLGQASRISGVTPAAVAVLMVHLKKAQG